MAGGCRPSGSISGVPSQMSAGNSLNGSLRSFPGSAAGGPQQPVAVPMVRHYSGSHSSGSLAGVSAGGLARPQSGSISVPGTALPVAPMPAGAVRVTGTSGPAIYSGPCRAYGPCGRQPDGTNVQASHLPALQQEMQKLRHAAAAQQEQIGQLFQELKRTREGKARYQQELDTARSEVARISEELSRERMARGRAEAAATEGQQALERNVAAREAWPSNADPVASPNMPSYNRGECTASFGLPGGRMSQDRPDRAVDTEARIGSPGQPLGAAGGVARPSRSAAQAFVASVQVAGQETPADRGASRNTQRRGSAKDDIDARFLDFLQNTDCPLVFKRKNRGFYSFRHADEGGKPSSNDRCVELSIVNAKLMARVEPDGHDDKGWNNGKLGPVERFVTFFSSARGN